MRDSPSEEDTPRESIEIDRDRYSTVRTVHTVHTIKEKRLPIEIRLRKSIHSNVMTYCALARMTAGQFYEEAAILFMDLNPVEGAVLIVEKPNKEDPSLKDRMLELMLIPELERWIGSTENVSGKLHPNKIKRLYKIIEQSGKIYNKSDKMQELLEEALNRVE